MAHYENEALGVSFDVADRITVRQQLAFRSDLSRRDEGGLFARYWKAAPAIVTNWQCALILDMTGVDLDAVDDPRVTDVIVWTADTVAGHMAGLETPEKKS